MVQDADLLEYELDLHYLVVKFHINPQYLLRYKDELTSLKLRITFINFKIYVSKSNIIFKYCSRILIPKMVKKFMYSILHYLQEI